MLTDRQQKFYIRIKELSNDGTNVSEKERKYLRSCVDEIEAEIEPYQKTINRLNYALIEKFKNNKGNKLSEKVEELTSDLIEIYGEPEKIVHGERILGIPFIYLG